MGKQGEICYKNCEMRLPTTKVVFQCYNKQEHNSVAYREDMTWFLALFVLIAVAAATEGNRRGNAVCEGERN